MEIFRVFYEENGYDEQEYEHIATYALEVSAIEAVRLLREAEKSRSPYARGRAPHCFDYERDIVL